MLRLEDAETALGGRKGAEEPHEASRQLRCRCRAEAAHESDRVVDGLHVDSGAPHGRSSRLLLHDAANGVDRKSGHGAQAE